MLWKTVLLFVIGIPFLTAMSQWTGGSYTLIDSIAVLSFVVLFTFAGRYLTKPRQKQTEG
ncbi:hypothetical protein ACFO4L_09215 [Bacillus daqingensis]|uniref:Uncharacterized protein n=1 Tax=Bacillus daqingensis TaxID=872396 RepID=A0ABV9NV39_9BACI